MTLANSKAYSSIQRFGWLSMLRRRSKHVVVLGEAKSRELSAVTRPRVLLCDHEAEHRELCCAALRVAYDLSVATCGGEALSIIRMQVPDVAIVERDLPDISGFDVLHLAKTIDPHLETILIATKPTQGDVIRALRERTADALAKPVAVPELQAAIEKALAFRTRLRLYQPGFTNETTDQRVHRLSDREYQVLRLLSEGLSTKDIAIRLELSEKSVRNYLSKIYQTLGVQSKTQAALVMRTAAPKVGTVDPGNHPAM